jgi:amidohydrolase
VPRAIDSRHPTVVTFGLIRGGDSQNVIPEKVILRGTARTTSHAATSRVEERIEEIAEGIAEASGTEIDVDFKRGPDAVVNDDDVTNTCKEAAASLLGAGALESIDAPSMGGEDFAEFQRKAPGCLMRLGVSQNPVGAAFLHSPRFDIDEDALSIGAKLIARAAVLLARPAD